MFMQLDRDGSVLRTYRFYDVFPTQVSPIDLGYDAQGIQEFTVELQVQWWEHLRVLVQMLAVKILTK